MASIEAGISQSPTAVEALVASFEGQADRAPSTVPVARPSEGLLFEAQQQAFDAQQQALICLPVYCVPGSVVFFVSLLCFQRRLNVDANDPLVDLLAQFLRG